ncbi:DNA-3-methyladenine glycosylase 2 family protein [Cryobacterium algoricola]|uniref:DNA-3-methyladenine glycosylase II n=2 Tax=Cryobacterium algoricola TaxID=1259183 RepID=A0ABY2IH33_9MICO|nr:DNA-3-methyladenine glycosylase 2 family protein [Cryobacterium algoricola]
MTESRQQAYAALARMDRDLGRLVDRYGTPDPFEFHDGGRTSGSNFAAMSLHILGQQISTTVAFLLYDRLRDAIGDTPTAKDVLTLGQDSIKALGTSRSKAGYLINLADHVASGVLDIENMGGLSDDDAIQALVAVTGIGVWSAELFLIHQLHRADIFPAGDVGLRKALKRLYGSAEIPAVAAAHETGRHWRPFRTYAAALLWRSLTVPVEL